MDELFDTYDCDKEEFLSHLSHVQAEVLRFSGFDTGGSMLFLDQLKALSTCLKKVNSARCLSVVFSTVQQFEIFVMEMEQLPNNTGKIEVVLDARRTGKQFDSLGLLAELRRIETVTKSRKVPLACMVPFLLSVRGAGDVTQLVEQLIQVKAICLIFCNASILGVRGGRITAKDKTRLDAKSLRP